TASHGWLATATQPVIHGCTSHLSFTIGAASVNTRSIGGPLGACALLKSVVASREAGVVCMVSSAFRVSKRCPATTAETRGRYMHAVCVTTALSAGGGGSAGGTGEAMRTTTLASVLFALTTTVSSNASVSAHTVSPARLSFFRSGGAPVNAT